MTSMTVGGGRTDSTRHHRTLSILSQDTCSEVGRRSMASMDGDSMTEAPSDETSILLVKPPSPTLQDCSVCVNRIISQIGVGRYQRKLFWLCGMGWLCDNLWLQTLAVCMPFIQQEFQLSDTFAAVGTSCAMVGMMVGAFLWGHLADAYGRKWVFNATLLICSLFGTLAAVSPNVTVLCCCFALMGFGIGGNLPIDGSLLLEFMTREHQNQLVLMSLFWPVGQVVASIFSWSLIPRLPSCPELGVCQPSLLHGWRWVIALSGLSTFSMFCCRCFFFHMLESPKFLLSVGKREEAMEVLQQLALRNQVHLDDFTLDDLPLIQARVDNATHSDYYQHVRFLFTESYRKTTVLVWIIWCIVSMAYTMVYAFLPRILNKSSVVFSAQLDFVIISSCGIPGSILAMFAVESSAGRKGTMVVATFMTGLALLSFASTTSAMIVLLSNCFANVTSNIMYGVLYAYTPEVFPTHVRGTASGVASALARLTGSIAPSLTGALLTVSNALPLTVSACLFCLQGICMLLLPLETRDTQAL